MKENCLHAYLATSNGTQPFVRPVSPIVEDDMKVWLTTFSTSRKVRHIRKNPRICLAFVEQPQGDKAAVIFGEAQIVADLEKKRKVWQLARFDLSQHFPDGPESKEFCYSELSQTRSNGEKLGKEGQKSAGQSNNEETCAHFGFGKKLGGIMSFGHY
jgi:general stress protein 26